MSNKASSGDYIMIDKYNLKITCGVIVFMVVVVVMAFLFKGQLDWQRHSDNAKYNPEAAYLYDCWNVVDDSAAQECYLEHATPKQDECVYLSPNIVCMYASDGVVVEVAHNIALKSLTDRELTENIVYWVHSNIEYDYAKARRLGSNNNEDNYVPYPEGVMLSRKGVCIDQTSLIAAMLRSQGIPCRIMSGNLGYDAYAHSWNEVYVDGEWLSIDRPDNTIKNVKQITSCY